MAWGTRLAMLREQKTHSRRTRVRNRRPVSLANTCGWPGLHRLASTPNRPTLIRSPNEVARSTTAAPRQARSSRRNIDVRRRHSARQVIRRLGRPIRSPRAAMHGKGNPQVHG